MSMHENSLQRKLLSLAKAHPDWDTKRYAAHLGMKYSTAVVSISRLRKMGLLPPRKKQTEEERKEKRKEQRYKRPKNKPVSKALPEKPLQTRSLVTRQTGYLKLM